MIQSVGTLAAAFLLACSTHAVPMFAAQAPAALAAGTVSSDSAAFISGIDRSQAVAKNEMNTSAFKKTGETTIQGKTVYYDQFGQPVSGRLETKEGTSYYSSEGERLTGFISDGDSTVYVDEETGMQIKGEQIVEEDGKSYLLNENGELQSGWQTFEGEEVYLDEDGSIVKNQTRDIDGARYSFDESGAKEVGITKDGYIYDENGKGVEDLTGYDKIAKAAIAQIGVNQDCTMLVTNSLKAVGINFHGSPESYLSLGPTTNNPVPGDIVVYSGHVAIYVGDGMAVHGGWNGYTTIKYSVSCANPLIAYVHPTLPA